MSIDNAQYAEFVDATGYITVAERQLDAAAFPGADTADLVPGSMVYDNQGVGGTAPVGSYPRKLRGFDAGRVSGRWSCFRLRYVS